MQEMLDVRDIAKIGRCSLLGFACDTRQWFGRGDGFYQAFQRGAMDFAKEARATRWSWFRFTADWVAPLATAK